MIEKQSVLFIGNQEKSVAFWQKAKEIANDAIEKTRPLLPAKNFEIRLFESENVIPNHGHAGQASLDGKKIKIGLNSDFFNQENLLHVELPRSVSHEMHHAARFQTLGRIQSLQDAIIREGLAVNFETEVWGGEPSAWATALSKEQLEIIIQQFQKETQVNDAGYDHSEWFYGKGKYPLWAGYSLGYHLVKDYLEKHPEETAAFLVSTPANVILDSIKKGKSNEQ